MRIFEVLSFWCGALDESGLASSSKQALWWQKDPEFDAEIEDRFGATLRRALSERRALEERSTLSASAAGQGDGANGLGGAAGGATMAFLETLFTDTAITAPPKARAALIILLDQFSRNIYRGSAEMYSGDPLALSLAYEQLSDPQFSILEMTYRVFSVMPLMHSETLADQERCCAVFAEFHAEAQGRHHAEMIKYTENNLHFAREHEKIVRRFGRFPHRNEILGRESSVEELEFLKTPGSSF